jgi:A-kinase anchor protein 1
MDLGTWKTLNEKPLNRDRHFTTLTFDVDLSLAVGIICAAPMFNGWYRALVVNVYDDSDEVDIKFVDYGGYSKVQACLLRQIRSDFTVLPFQAIECYLANIVPPTGE